MAGKLRTEELSVVGTSEPYLPILNESDARSSRKYPRTGDLENMTMPNAMLRYEKSGPRVEVSSDVLKQVAPTFCGDIRAAAFKTLGL